DAAGAIGRDAARERPPFRQGAVGKVGLGDLYVSLLRLAAKPFPQELRPGVLRFVQEDAVDAAVDELQLIGDARPAGTDIGAALAEQVGERRHTAPDSLKQGG